MRRLNDHDTKEKKGMVIPRHSRETMKYGETNLPKIVRVFLVYKLPVRIPSINMKLLGASLAQSTWKRYGAALNKWRSFAKSRKFCWKKISERERGNFIGWCKGRGDLTTNTVKIYLGALWGLTELKNLLRVVRVGENFFRPRPTVQLRRLTHLSSTVICMPAHVFSVG
jgi:hypothetical protein